MADYLTKFSLVVPLPNEAACEYARDVAQQAARMQEGETIQAGFPETLLEHVEDWHFETEGDRDEGSLGVWLHSTNGGIDAVCAFIQHLLRRFSLRDFIALEWSNDCSKPQLDAYGGGAAIITAKRIKSVTTSEWVLKHSPKI
jgi:hypothetical protein